MEETLYEFDTIIPQNPALLEKQLKIASAVMNVTIDQDSWDKIKGYKQAVRRADDLLDHWPEGKRRPDVSLELAGYAISCC